jgi:hypothetical protein
LNERTRRKHRKEEIEIRQTDKKHKRENERASTLVPPPEVPRLKRSAQDETYVEVDLNNLKKKVKKIATS